VSSEPSLELIPGDSFHVWLRAAIGLSPTSDGSKWLMCHEKDLLIVGALSNL
jgi:hypothetical protein